MEGQPIEILPSTIQSRSSNADHNLLEKLTTEEEITNIQYLNKVIRKYSKKIGSCKPKTMKKEEKNMN